VGSVLVSVWCFWVCWGGFGVRVNVGLRDV